MFAAAPEITANPRLESLAAVIHHESERLNVEIQNILDASRISSDGLQVKLEWAEPADFVNAALERCRHRLAKHPVEVNMPDELVLLQIDPVLMERALGQILDNAAKYSPEGSMIDVQGRRETDSFVLTVTDRGAGLDPSDRSLLGQKFFRGKRHAQSTSGLGLGFWIANAFVGANQGTVEAASEASGETATWAPTKPMRRSGFSRFIASATLTSEGYDGVLVCRTASAKSRAIGRTSARPSPRAGASTSRLSGTSAAGCASHVGYQNERTSRLAW